MNLFRKRRDEYREYKEVEGIDLAQQFASDEHDLPIVPGGLRDPDVWGADPELVRGFWGPEESPEVVKARQYLQRLINEQLTRLMRQQTEAAAVVGDGPAGIVVALQAQHDWLSDYRLELMAAGIL